jgi:hypothetical protein
LISIENLKVRLSMKQAKFDVISNNVLGRDRESLPGYMAINISQIMQLFLKMYSQLKVGNLVKKKRSQSSFEKLSQFLRFKDIVISFFVKLLQMALFRLIEINIKQWSIEVDDCKILKDEQLDTYDDVKNPNKKKEFNKDKAHWSEEQELNEKYQYVWKDHGMGVDAIQKRYFDDKTRSRVIAFDFEQITVEFNFSQSEQFYMFVQSDQGHMYVYSKNSSTIFTESEISNPHNKRRDQHVTSKSAFLILMAKGASFKVKYPMKMNTTLAYINSSIKFYFHESQFFLNKKSMELFLSFFWNIKLMNNIRSYAKKTKIESVNSTKSSPGYNYLMKQ